MYDDHYGLTGRPFQLTPDARFWFDTATHRKAMAYLGYGLAQGEGFIVVTGDVGAGKTTLVGHLMATIDRDRLNVVKLVSTQIEAEDLLRLVAEAMAVPATGLNKAQLLLAIERGLHATARAGKRTLLIVDEAQALPVSALEELRMLSNFQAGGHPLLQIFLLGQPEFRERLHGSDRLEQLRQRVIAVHHLDPMGAEEVEPYMVHRLTLVGWQGRPAFTAAAYAALYGASDGVPRRLNQIAGRVLLYGAVERLERIDEAVVATVLADIAGDTRVPVAAPAVHPAPVLQLVTDETPALDTETPVETIVDETTAEAPAAAASDPEPAEVEAEPVPVELGLVAATADDELEPLETANDVEEPGDSAVAVVAPPPLAEALDRIAALEMRVEEQDAALRRMLTLLVDWVEGEHRSSTAAAR